jgi:hypothetical protein
MSSFRQIEANRRNAHLSTVLAEIRTVIADLPSYGYARVWAVLRRRAVVEGRQPANRKRVYRGPCERGGQETIAAKCGHGLTAETVITALEDAEDFAAFEMAVTADYDAQTAVERELVLRLASLLWRLRRATAIESGLFKIQAKHLLQFRQRRQAHQKRQEIIDGVYRNALATEETMHQDDAVRLPAAAGGLCAGGCARPPAPRHWSGRRRSSRRWSSLRTVPGQRQRPQHRFF